MGESSRGADDQAPRRLRLGRVLRTLFVVAGFSFLRDRGRQGGQQDGGPRPTVLAPGWRRVPAGRCIARLSLLGMASPHSRGARPSPGSELLPIATRQIHSGGGLASRCTGRACRPGRGHVETCCDLRTGSRRGQRRCRGDDRRPRRVTPSRSGLAAAGARGWFVCLCARARSSGHDHGCSPPSLGYCVVPSTPTRRSPHSTRSCAATPAPSAPLLLSARCSRSCLREPCPTSEPAISPPYSQASLSHGPWATSSFPCPVESVGEKPPSCYCCRRLPTPRT